MPAQKSAFQKTTAFVIIAALLLVSLMPTIVSSEDLGTIKVLLLNGAANYQQLATVSSPNELTVATNSVVPFTKQLKQNEQLGIQFDRYLLQVVETTDLNQVITLLSKVQGIAELNIKPTIEIISKNSQTTYRLIAGSYASLEELNQVKKTINDKIQVNGKALGSLYWSLGQYNTIEEANQAIVELGKNSFAGYLVQVFANNQWRYEVWVGEASTLEEQSNLRLAILAKLPSVSLQDAAAANYLIYKKTAYLKGSQLESYQLLNFSPEAKVSIKATGENTAIKVRERSYSGSSNSYRGELTIQLFNGKISVVNTLSLEKYLYSVVGSEMNTSWHLEALKAQAVAARTFAYSKMLYPRNSIAQIYDTVDDQAYYGVAKEASKVIQAVDETKGYVVLSNNKPISTFYSSNAGGITSSGAEAWGESIPYASAAKTSTFDSLVLDTTMKWYRVIRDNGQTGYIRSDLINLLDKPHSLGLQYGIVNDTAVNFRTGPSIYRFPVIATLPLGEELSIIEIVYENNPYSWIAGPFTADFLLTNINKYQLPTSSPLIKPPLDLQVIERGVSGRVTLIADGSKPIPVKYPDYYRTLFGSLDAGVQSTLFTIVQQGRVEVLGANGAKKTIINNPENFSTISASGTQTLNAANNRQSEYVILSGSGEIKLATKEQTYILRGQGFGHGVGMSQWGAKGLADSGYNYQGILQYYYNNIVIKQIY